MSILLRLLFRLLPTRTRPADPSKPVPSDAKIEVIVASDISARDGVGVELYVDDEMVLEIFRDDTKKTRTFSQYKRDLPLNIVEESIDIFKQKIPWDFMDDVDNPSDQVIDQRIRNRIIEYLELASSFEDQRIYQSKAPVHVPNEVINQWEDWVPDPRRPHFSEPVFSRDEQHAIIAYHQVWTEVCEAIPKRLPGLEVLFDTAEWQRLRDAAATASAVFSVRGKMPEDAAFVF